MPPGNPGGQHVHHRREHRPRAGPSRTPTLRARGEPRQQRSGNLPQLIRHQPARQRIFHPPRLPEPPALPPHETSSKVTGEVEARLIALACSQPPEGYDRWSLRLLEKHVVLTDGLPALDHSTIGRVLKKRHFALI